MIKAIIEIPKGSNYKYEIDKETGQLTLDRVIQLEYPTSYGFIIDTLAPDSDALDVFIISNKEVPPLTVVKVNVLGVFKCTDNGVSDDKLIATLEGEVIKPNAIGYHRTAIDLFLSEYKEGFIVDAYLSQKPAEQILKKCSDEFILNRVREGSKF